MLVIAFKTLFVHSWASHRKKNHPRTVFYLVKNTQFWTSLPLFVWIVASFVQIMAQNNHNKPAYSCNAFEVAKITQIGARKRKFEKTVFGPKIAKNGVFIVVWVNGSLDCVQNPSKLFPNPSSSACNHYDHRSSQFRWLELSNLPKKKKILLFKWSLCYFSHSFERTAEPICTPNGAKWPQNWVSMRRSDCEHLASRMRDYQVKILKKKSLRRIDTQFCGHFAPFGVQIGWAVRSNEWEK